MEHFVGMTLGREWGRGHGSNAFKKRKLEWT